MSEICRSDAAYVLGALSPADRRDFEDHLRDCADCQASVQRMAGLPGLLALTTAEELEDGGPRVPDSLLPGLIARAHAANRRRSWITGGLLAAAVAVVLVLTGALIYRQASESAEYAADAPGTSTLTPSSAPPALQEPMDQVLPGPMTASLELVDKKWGTAITVICQYEQDVDPAVAYNLAVIETDGQLDQAGTWLAVPGATSRVSTATAVPRDRIAALEVRLPDGRTVLRSTP